MTLLERQLEASVREHESTHAMTVVSQQPLAPVLRFTEDQEAMIRDTYANGASPSEFKVLMEVAKARNLNPLLKQVFFVKRWDSQKERFIWAAQVSIDGLRAIAERTRMYDGQDEPEFEHDKDGFIVLARVRVYKKGIPRPFVGVARWGEYVQKKKDNKPTKFWADMPYTMLGKCAEALAIRKAFPEDSGGLYVPEEMMQAENGRAQLEHQEEPRQLGAINPHDDGGDYSNTDESVFDELMGRMREAETKLAACRSYDDVLALEEYIGSKAKQSPLTRDLQAAMSAGKLTPDQHKALSKIWAHVYRELTKDKPPGLKLRFPPPSAVDSFSDPPEDDSDDFDRGA